MKNILVPIDFSDASKNAAQYAVSMAKFFEAKVIFFHVVPAVLIVDQQSALARIRAQEEMIEKTRNSVENEVQALSENYDEIQGFVAEGSATDAIIDMAAQNQTDLVVMGMKGKGESNSVFGSTTTSVIRKSKFPVLVIPENASYKEIDTITFATDFDDETEKEHYHILTEIADRYDSYVQVLNVQKDEATMTDEEFVGKLKTHFAITTLKHSFNSIEDKSVIQGISKFIDENPSDMLVMMAQKHSFFERMLGTIHTREMSYETKIPLLVLQNK